MSMTNRGSWRIKGTHVAADMLRVYFADQGKKGVRYPHNYRGPKRKLIGIPPVPQSEVEEKKDEEGDNASSSESESS